MAIPSSCRLVLGLFWFPIFLAADPALAPLTVAHPDRSTPVDFDSEILPVLQANCLPCHNKTTTKAELILETPADILKGGESGPALLPGKSAESLVFQLAAHQAKPRMPPKENKVNAVALQPEELGLLALWIEQGAHASERRHVDIAWQALGTNIQAIYSAALSANGRFALCGRGNQLFLFDTEYPKPLARLDDPSLSGNAAPAAHRDMVNSVAISPDAEWVASGGYREIKLWQRVVSQPGRQWTKIIPGTNRFPAAVLPSPDGRHSLQFTSNRVLELVAPKGRPTLALGLPRALPAADPERLRQFTQSELDFAKLRAEAATKEADSQTIRLTKSTEALRTARGGGMPKFDAESNARMELSIAEAAAARLERSGAKPGEVKAAREQVNKLRPVVDPAAAESAKVRIKISTAGEEERLADLSLTRALTLQLVAQRRLREATVRMANLATLAPSPTNNVRIWPAAPTTAAWSPDGRVCAVAFPDAIQVWSGTTGSWMASTPVGHPVERLVIESPDVIRWQQADDGRSWKWSWQPRWELRHSLGSGDDRSPISDRVNALAFRADGQRLASGSGEPTRGGEIRVWNPSTGNELYAFTNRYSDTVLALAFSPDGLRLASGGADRFARILDLATGRQVAALEGHSGHVLSLSWRFDGRVLATGGADNVIKFWNIATGERGKTVTGFTKEITGLAHIGTAGDVIAASGETDLRRVTESGEKPVSYAGSHGFQHTAAVSLDGRWLIAGGQDGILRLWEVDSGKLIREFTVDGPTVVAR